MLSYDAGNRLTGMTRWINSTDKILSTQTYGGGYQPMAQIPFTHVPETPDPGDAHIEPEADAAQAPAAAS